jgi:hypothetical protein
VPNGRALDGENCLRKKGNLCQELIIHDPTACFDRIWVMYSTSLVPEWFPAVLFITH